MNPSLVTRFAPSPTGYLHPGHALAALTARALADRMGGRCLLRIEDLDQTRCRPVYIRAIADDLAWLGIHFDGPVMIQSERIPLYQKALSRLRELGVLYPCFCTRKEIAAEVEAMGGAPQGTAGEIYPGTCRLLSAERREELLHSGRPYSWRLDCRAAARLTGPLGWTDERFGEQLCDPEDLGDVILGRKDSPASYHLAVVVDDASQGVTLVSRGDDLFPSTGIHRTLQALLELPVPHWLHHRLIYDSDGKRMAKRIGSRSLRDMREEGMSPEEVLHLIQMSQGGAKNCF